MCEWFGQVVLQIFSYCYRYYGNGRHILSAGQDRAFRLFSVLQVDALRCVISFVTYFDRKSMVYNEMNFGNVFNCSMCVFFIRN